jgi:hypothetical protein
MIEHPATIELIEKLGELAKNFGALLVKYAERLRTEPSMSVKVSTEELFLRGAQSEKGRQVIINEIQRAQVQGKL